jgi:hypothetical protein
VRVAGVDARGVSLSYFAPRKHVLSRSERRLYPRARQLVRESGQSEVVALGRMSRLIPPARTPCRAPRKTREGRLITLTMAHGPIIPAPYVTSSPIKSSPEQNKADRGSSQKWANRAIFNGTLGRIRERNRIDRQGAETGTRSVCTRRSPGRERVRRLLGQAFGISGSCTWSWCSCLRG